MVICSVYLLNDLIGWFHTFKRLYSLWLQLLNDYTKVVSKNYCITISIVIIKMLWYN